MVAGALTVVVGSSLDDSDVLSALAVSMMLLFVVIVVDALVVVVGSVVATSDSQYRSMPVHCPSTCLENHPDN